MSLAGVPARRCTRTQARPSLIIAHDVGFVMRLSRSRLTVLDFGRVIASGRPDAVQQDPAGTCESLSRAAMTTMLEVTGLERLLRPDPGGCAAISLTGPGGRQLRGAPRLPTARARPALLRAVSGLLRGPRRARAASTCVPDHGPAGRICDRAPRPVRTCPRAAASCRPSASTENLRVGAYGNAATVRRRIAQDHAMVLELRSRSLREAA